jgi:hypothetical protein
MARHRRTRCSCGVTAVGELGDMDAPGLRLDHSSMPLAFWYADQAAASCQKG